MKHSLQLEVMLHTWKEITSCI